MDADRPFDVSGASAVGDSVTVESERPLDVALTLAPHGRGPRDPTQRRTPDGAVWRTSRQPGGPVTYRVTQPGRHTARVQAWGPGAADVLARARDLVGADDDASTFAPRHPLLVEAHRRHPHLRIGSTGRVFEALVPAVLEQRVHTIAAHRSWAWLVRRYGSPAPGPAPRDLLVPPEPRTWRTIPSWAYHRAGVDPSRSRTLVRCAEVADSLERAATAEYDEFVRRVTSLPGVGVWTAAHTAQRALGAADALAIGDYNIPDIVGWTLEGRAMADAEMVEYLDHLRPHRHRAVWLLMVSGAAYKPKRGPRTPLVDHTWH
ncbi:DNA-3-methyladenine glycosylase family protein [Rhodococcus rhodnii]|uniref:DNA-3-methyladenine glycosylase II n=1 Tax=Rhodococcus rhodnii LMG 5362 TaxID=1273125 RepID=R7WJ64_9NOCA|nr:hypothetical protein Rrhod_3355 [Rhodococcus rhodnii LMG 5362]